MQNKCFKCKHNLPFKSYFYTPSPKDTVQAKMKILFHSKTNLVEV